jgi:hypothetical protein
MFDLIGVWVGAILTLLVFSYLLHDTPLFRIAQAIFVGVAVGYAVTVAVRSVLIPLLFEPMVTTVFVKGDVPWLYFVPLILGLLLFTKLRADWASLGNPSIAFLFGVGSALAIGGALSGALLPQLKASIVSLSPTLGGGTVNNLLLLIGTVGAFLSFRFIIPTGNRAPLRALDVVARAWGRVGRWFILVAFGAIFADTAVSRISILIGRFYYLLHDWLQVVK